MLRCWARDIPLFGRIADKEYFAGGFVGFREGATAATPVPKSCQAPSAALRMRQDACRPLSVTAVLRAVEQSGGTTRSGLCDTFGCTLNESAAQLDRCLSQVRPTEPVCQCQSVIHAVRARDSCKKFTLSTSTENFSSACKEPSISCGRCFGATATRPPKHH
jgi:hypothetical protein